MLGAIRSLLNVVWILFRFVFDSLVDLLMISEIPTTFSCSAVLWTTFEVGNS